MDNKSLYQRHKIIYNDPVSGKFDRIRLLSMSFIAFLYFVLPWLTFNGEQAFLFDISYSKFRFYFFGSVIWPQDFILLSILFATAILVLFVVTIYAGRIWCGFLCPQTIWVRVAVFFSKLIEGNRNKRKKIDESPYNVKIFFYKLLKHFIWFIFSFFTGFTFIAYFIPIKFLYSNLINFNIFYWSFFWVMFFSILTYINISWFREQMCFIACPYSRLQGAMFDSNTLIVAYDFNIGEKRGPRKKDQNYKELGLGLCIDCKKCVTCCPTGIDIRNGLQMECISCAACIDACDEVMDKMNYPRGLIRYLRESSLIGISNKVSKYRFLAYFIILSLILSLFTYILLMRPLVHFSVTRSQNQLYNITKEGLIENFYLLKITNKTKDRHAYSLSICDDSFSYVGMDNIVLNGEETIVLDVKAVMKKIDSTSRFIEIFFKVEGIDFKKNSVLMKKSKFIIPK